MALPKKLTNAFEKVGGHVLAREFATMEEYRRFELEERAAAAAAKNAARDQKAVDRYTKSTFEPPPRPRCSRCGQESGVLSGTSERGMLCADCSGGDVRVVQMMPCSHCDGTGEVEAPVVELEAGAMTEEEAEYVG